MRLAITLLAMLFAAGCLQSSAAGAVFPRDGGHWPKDWPAELEPLRKSARTLGIGTGIQQDIYEIPIPDRATFEKVWPAILKVRTPGSPLTLYRIQTAPPKDWGDLLSNDVAAIRIYAPSGGFSMKEEIDVKNPPDFEQLIKQGRALRAAPPWPEKLVSEKGELPEFVVSKKREGKLVWVAGDPRNSKPGDGFYNRARVDVELVIDGEIIDLNRVELPDGVTVIDHRFDEDQTE